MSRNISDSALASAAKRFKWNRLQPVLFDLKIAKSFAERVTINLEETDCARVLPKSSSSRHARETQPPHPAAQVISLGSNSKSAASTRPTNLSGRYSVEIKCLQPTQTRAR